MAKKPKSNRYDFFAFFHRAKAIKRLSVSYIEHVSCTEVRLRNQHWPQTHSRTWQRLSSITESQEAMLGSRWLWIWFWHPGPAGHRSYWWGQGRALPGPWSHMAKPVNLLKATRIKARTELKNIIFSHRRRVPIPVCISCRVHQNQRHRKGQGNRTVATLPVGMVGGTVTIII